MLRFFHNSNRQQNTPTVEYLWEKIEGNLKMVNTEPSMLFRRANTEPSIHFKKANTEPSMHFKKANTEPSMDFKVLI